MRRRTAHSGEPCAHSSGQSGRCGRAVCTNARSAADGPQQRRVRGIVAAAHNPLLARWGYLKIALSPDGAVLKPVLA
jgi:hypothetical protein